MHRLEHVHVVDERDTLTGEATGEPRLRECELERAVRRRAKVALDRDRDLHSSASIQHEEGTHVALRLEVLCEDALRDGTVRLCRHVVELGGNDVRAEEEVEGVDVGPSDDVVLVDDLELDEVGEKNQRSGVGEDDVERDANVLVSTPGRVEVVSASRSDDDGNWEI